LKSLKIASKLNELAVNRRGLVHVSKNPWTNKQMSTYCWFRDSEKCWI